MLLEQLQTSRGSELLQTSRPTPRGALADTGGLGLRASELLCEEPIWPGGTGGAGGTWVFIQAQKHTLYIIILHTAYTYKIIYIDIPNIIGIWISIFNTL